MKLLKSLLTTVFSIVISLYRAFVLVKLWLWFVVPQFHLNALTFTNAFGMMLIVEMVTTSLSVRQGDYLADKSLTKTEKTAISVTNYLIAVVLPSTVLLMGYITHVL